MITREGLSEGEVGRHLIFLFFTSFRFLWRIYEKLELGTTHTYQGEFLDMWSGTTKIEKFYLIMTRTWGKLYIVKDGISTNIYTENKPTLLHHTTHFIPLMTYTIFHKRIKEFVTLYL